MCNKKYYFPNAILLMQRAQSAESPGMKGSWLSKCTKSALCTSYSLSEFKVIPEAKCLMQHAPSELNPDTNFQRGRHTFKMARNRLVCTDTNGYMRNHAVPFVKINGCRHNQLTKWLQNHYQLIIVEL